MKSIIYCQTYKRNMAKFEYETIEELQQEVRKGKLNENLLDWESSAKISEWLAKQPGQTQYAAILGKEYQKAINESEQLKAILTALSLSEHEISSLLAGVSVEEFQPIPPTLEELNKQVKTLNQHTEYRDNFKVVIGTISLLPAEGVPTSSGWIPCEGQRLSTKYFEVLFARLGTAHGGDGKSYFSIPDLRPDSICKNYKYYLFTGLFGDIPKNAFINIKDLLPVNEFSIDMILVEGGTFMMGSTSGGSDEQPVHSVALPSYYIGKYPVTQALWKAVMNGNNPSHSKGNRLPVKSVSYIDCQKFIKKLNKLTGQEYRLPTEAEWEFAARGGNKSRGYTYSGSNSLLDVGWYAGNSSDKTHPVGELPPNELGIHDMSGNVWEWCSDWYSSYSNNTSKTSTGSATGTNRVHRGGSWYDFPSYCRIAYRGNHSPDYSYNNLGFRLAFTP